MDITLLESKDRRGFVNGRLGGYLHGVTVYSEGNIFEVAPNDNKLGYKLRTIENRYDYNNEKYLKSHLNDKIAQSPWVYKACRHKSIRCLWLGLLASWRSLRIEEKR